MGNPNNVYCATCDNFRSNIEDYSAEEVAAIQANVANGLGGTEWPLFNGADLWKKYQKLPIWSDLAAQTSEQGECRLWIEQRPSDFWCPNHQDFDGPGA